jgi:hypothetical protein
MGYHRVIHNGETVASYAAKYMAQDHARHINDEERRARQERKAQQAHKKAQQMKNKNESFELDEALDEANFAATMKKAIAAHERGDHKRAKYHLDNAKTARYAMKSTEISKNKEMLDKYEKLRGMHEEVEQLDIEEANTSHRHHVVSKLDGNVLASYKTKQDAHKNAHGNPVVSGSLETIGDKQYVKEVAERATHRPNNGQDPEQGLSPNAKKEKDRTTPIPAMVNEPQVDKLNFQTFKTMTKKSPMRPGDNAQGDKTSPKAK